MADEAVVRLEKLEGYSLDPTHPVGKHKARVSSSALGMTKADAPRLRELILQAVLVNDAAEIENAIHGTRYRVDFSAIGLKGSVKIRTAWIIDSGETIPRPTNCYVKGR